MNLLLSVLMDKPSVLPSHCVICGLSAHDKHHVVPRSQGGHKGPQMRLCGSGNVSGCHGLAHAKRLHFRYAGEWEYLLTECPMKYDTCLGMGGWRKLPS